MRRKIKSFYKWFRSFPRDEDGVAALMAVILAVIIIGTIITNFLVESQQKQAGGALSYSSANAFLMSEAGLRFAEKCLLEGGTSEAGCPCTSWTGGCDDWTTAPANFPSDISFGDSRGSFEIQVTPIDSSQITVTSIGKFAGALRAFTKIVAKTCQLQESAITACTSIEFKNNSSVDPSTQLSSAASSGATSLSVDDNTGFTVGIPIQITDPSGTPLETAEVASLTGSTTITLTSALTNSYAVNSDVGPPQVTGVCNLPAVAALTFPGTCPGEDDFDDDATLNANKYYCSWKQTTTFADNPIPDGTTIWVNGNMDLTDNADLEIDGTVTINILGNLKVKNNAEIRLSSSPSTQLSSAASASDTTITVSSSAGFLAGRSITIVDASGSPEETAVIASIPDGTSIALTSGLSNAYAVNSAVSTISSLTIHVDGDFTQSNNSKLNNTAGDPANLIVLVGGDGAMRNNITFKGGLYGSNITLDLKNNAEVIGSIVVESVKLGNNATIVFDESAGSNTVGISTCGASGAASTPVEP
ncbi:hypothetical protein UR09_05995 [Candidatus Nitromaritima sp. SCGC AAA799-A02]|nr:hypothetical protein UR09_05995 [Candidatus Nitromaritima sp. SCGC AAA799-A02]KMP10947.1 hypothetical protein UZ36_05990 [Candidatus Nitromaritima sp. SCGC AAA799-C22]